MAPYGGGRDYVCNRRLQQRAGYSFRLTMIVVAVVAAIVYIVI